jgi:3-hydroxyisobutyrate dehydrogenase-like beta-hydroxyacid dehydrogenase
MSSVSFIGLGGMACAIAARAVAGGNAVELIGRDAANDDATGLVAPDGASAAQEIARAVPASAHVVRASSSPVLPYNSNEGCTT